MQIEQRSDGDLLELTVSGALDNESSMHFRAAIDEHVRDGWHRILVHMQGVTYISSAGINVLLDTKKRLEQLEGLFGICTPAREVEDVLARTQLLDFLLCEPDQARAHPSAGTLTRSLSSRIVTADDLDLQIFTLDEDASSLCRVIGDPRPLFESTFVEQNCRSVEFSDHSFGFGLGALGDSFASASARFGEFLSVAGAVAQSAQSRRKLPDYSWTQGEFTPRVQVLYGIQCEGGFPHLIRFRSVETGEPVVLSAVVSLCLKEAACSRAGIVILAESAGLLGAQLRRSPAVGAGAVQRFDFPEVRDWLSFSPERVYSRSLALLVGIAQASTPVQPSSSLERLLRPIDADGDLYGHFHAAAFPYRPLKQRTLDLHTSTRELFETGTIQDVLHLLRDDRTVVGVGESEFLGGACWLSPIREIAPGEVHA
jgi:anti-anti-sigma factor